jgi:hypothetical protein
MGGFLSFGLMEIIPTRGEEVPICEEFHTIHARIIPESVGLGQWFAGIPSAESEQEFSRSRCHSRRVPPKSLRCCSPGRSSGLPRNFSSACSSSDPSPRIVGNRGERQPTRSTIRTANPATGPIHPPDHNAPSSRSPSLSSGEGSRPIRPVSRARGRPLYCIAIVRVTDRAAGLLPVPVRDARSRTVDPIDIVCVMDHREVGIEHHARRAEMSAIRTKPLAQSAGTPWCANHTDSKGLALATL